MIFDTDVLIWVQRGSARAASAVKAASTRMISTMTLLELLQLASNRMQLIATKSFLADFRFEVVPFSANIGHRAIVYLEEYGIAHGLHAGDALVAATASELGMPLVSGNYKHFKAIKDLRLIRFKP